MVTYHYILTISNIYYIYRGYGMTAPRSLSVPALSLHGRGVLYQRSEQPSSPPENALLLCYIDTFANEFKTIKLLNY